MKRLVALVCWLSSCVPPAAHGPDAGEVVVIDEALRCDAGAPTFVTRFDGVLGGDSLMVGDGTVMSWSHHHYTAPIFGSEVWWPWCLVGRDAALCASSTPWRVFRLVAAAGELEEVLDAGRPMAGTLRDGVVYGTDRRLWRSVGDGGLVATDVVLPEALLDSPDAWGLERGSFAPLAMKSGERLVWRSQSGSAFVTSLADGTSRELAPTVDAVAVSSQLLAWGTASSLHVNDDTWAVSRSRPSLAAVAQWLAWLDGETVRARSLDGGTAQFTFDAGVAALASEACHVYVLTDSGDVFRLALPVP